MAEPPRLLIWVQHLLGVGHAMRAAALARSFADAGWSVALASGGPPPAGLDPGRAEVHPLPPLRAADPEFACLVTGSGAPPDPAFWSRRARLLTDLVNDTAPDAILVEHYPFGRRAFRGEVHDMLAARRRHPAPFLTICSVRDILVDRKPERAEEAAGETNRHFDLVLVHGDPELVPFEASFPRADQIADKIRYTGYIGGGDGGGRGHDDAQGQEEADEVLVSAGGGAVGDALIETAIDAARMRGDRIGGDPSGGDRLGWRILVGRNSARAPADWSRAAPDRVVLEAARPDFRRLLARATVSVSQAGYNTVVDILQARARAILVPFARERETEQTLRAERLAARGLARHLPQAELTPSSLNAAVDVARAAPRPEPDIRLDGEAEAVRILDGLVGRR